MELREDDPRPPLETYEALAKLIDHAVLRPDFSEEQVAEGCAIARQYNVAAVIVRPSDADLASRWMAGSGVALGSVVDYPEGSGTTSAKLFATADLLRRGVREIDTVINIGKMIARQFQYVEMELQQMAKACHDAGAILKVAFENAYLTEDLKIIACKIARRAEIDYARTSTPFSPSGYSLDDVALMRRCLNGRVQLKASARIRTMEQVVELHQAGCSRIGTIATVAILEAWKT
ncbi:MAG: deoxyribose-phosphate aldolase, partial [Bryobacteraceae bacterium]